MTKKIEAIFREEKLHIVKEALYQIGIVGMNVESDEDQLAVGQIASVGRVMDSLAVFREELHLSRFFDWKFSQTEVGDQFH